eukprot:3323003-Alexandrium_andersonii.AAC.1
MLVFGARFIAAIALRVVVLENVVGFAKGHRGKWIAKVRRLLAAAGYKVSAMGVDAIDMLPQHRERVLVVGVRWGIASLSMVEADFLLPKDVGRPRKASDVGVPADEKVFSEPLFDQLALKDRR